MNELNGKRLLILGGSQWKDTIKDFAKENNITLIATGNDHSAGIFKIADECYNIDSTDSENMKKLIIEKNIDGVYMGGSEPVITTACQYINELGLPCYCTKEQWEYLQNKSNFKELCMKFDLPVVQKYDVNDNNINNNLNIDFPVITKPVDGCASNGFSVCNNMIELKKGYEKAKECSPTGSVIVEKYVPNDGIVVIYSFSNGNINFCTIEDKYPVKYEKQGSYVGGLFTFESECIKEFRELYEEKLSNLFKDINIKEGTIWIEVFHNNGNYYFNETGYRYGGSISIFPVNYFTEINQVAADIYYALTGKSKLFGFNSLIKKELPLKQKYGIYCVHIKPGTITKVTGIEEINNKENIINCFETKPLNYEVEDTGSFNQVYALIHFVYKDKNELEETINVIHNTLKVYDENGNNMINKMLDIDKLEL